MVSLSYSETTPRRRMLSSSRRAAQRASLWNWRLGVALLMNAFAWSAIYLLMARLP